MLPRFGYEGGRCAVDVALGAHEAVLSDADVLTSESWIRSDRPRPESGAGGEVCSISGAGGAD